ncbi:MAG: 1-(5-phosphoribosyl)-5-[(5-phosphoribosylamino)methylideneamino] imidazole-4-carboxamide isomerase [Cytophagales bacterium]|nr:MAG: 1-(5-phosphoribosyl)-5-[(5-phosphoribosylamino)methylideneamino] imidazole-4-carboxamide isomerase [Cytophagales bacterium]
MIEVIPSIAIAGGKVVKTVKGDIDELIVYDKDPIELAKEFEDNGLKRLHLIDLDGAKQRKIINYHIIEQIARYTELKIDFSGGITRDMDIRMVFESGASYATVATVAVHEKEKFYSWFITYGGERIILAADALNKAVLTKGWQKDTHLNLMEHINHYHHRGIKYVKTTEIARDGTLLGPAFELYKEILEESPELKILACGGIRGIEDIEKLNEIGVFGIIFSKSYYEGKLKLKDLAKFL